MEMKNVSKRRVNCSSSGDGKPEYEPSKGDPEIPAPRQPNPELPDVGDPPHLTPPLRDPPLALLNQLQPSNHRLLSVKKSGIGFQPVDAV